jgi:tetratricopeptide (TPR) repeat protein
LNRAYHTTTSAFNVNFNAKEALKEGEKELETKSVDNYTMRLPIYNYPAKSDIISIYPFMDRCIEKCSKSIYKHSMMIRGVEHVRTMDDVYLLMGKAYFHKQDYVQAQRIFNYIAHTFNGKNWNCREEAMIMGVRTALRQQYYSRAQELLDDIQISFFNTSKSGNKKLRVLYNAALAEYRLTLSNGEILAVIDDLNEAIKNNPNRQFKTRLYFILGQLYEELGQANDAQKCFKMVIKRTPPYEMEFNAHIHLATNYDGSKNSKTEILKSLNKMLVDSKNADYKDRIYYAMSQIAKIDEDEDLQIQNLILSVANYSNNNYQRTLSAITLADIYFDKELFIEAQSYYDTATLSLPNNYPNRENIIQKSKVLKDLVVNLNTITYQDSLQRIAKMSPQQREVWVRNMIHQYREKKRQEEEEEANRMLIANATSHMMNINVNNPIDGGKWYFYNQSLVSSGKTDFYRNWGKRKLEDNWRISNKQQISLDELAVMNDPSLAKDTAEYDENGNLIRGRENDPEKPVYYTQDLPLTKGAMDTSNMIIVSAMYNAAIIYLDLLNDYKRSNETFEKLINRFPEDELTLPSIFMLYRNYTALKNPKAEEYKNIILTKYADTDYAKLITNPDYYKKLAEINKVLEQKYETTYEVFLQKQWATTVRMANEALAICEEPVLSSKYAYLRAIALGQITNEDTLKRALSDIVVKYPSTEVAGLARIFLSSFDNADKLLAAAGDSTSIALQNKIEAKKNVFVYKAKELHYVIILVDVSSLPVNEVKKDVANFNQEFYSLQKFNISSHYIDANHQIVTIGQFTQKETAMEYYQNIIRNGNFSGKIKDRSLSIYAISASNYTAFYTNIDERDSYPAFFEEYYLK